MSGMTAAPKPFKGPLPVEARIGKYVGGIGGAALGHVVWAIRVLPLHKLGVLGYIGVMAGSIIGCRWAGKVAGVKIAGMRGKGARTSKAPQAEPMDEAAAEPAQS